MSDDTIPTSKVCTKCLLDLPFESYNKCKLGKHGLRSDCKRCRAARVAAYRQANPDKVRSAERKHYTANREKILQKAKDFRLANLDAVRESERRWYAENAESVLERKNKWRRDNRDDVRARERDRYQENREHFLAKNKFYRSQNPDYWKQHQMEHREMYAAYQGRRRAKLRGIVSPNFSYQQLLARIDYFGGKCWMCGDPWEHMDHVKPINNGGPHLLANLRPACSSCNIAKGSKWPYTPPTKQEHN